MIIRYVYDYSNGKRPVACLVVYGKDCGVSFCNKKDRFCKKRALQIALGRLYTGSETPIPNRKIVNFVGVRTNLIDEVNFYLEKMTTNEANLC